MTALRAARWSRVSSAKQAKKEKEGLPYQHDLQDEALAVLRAQDTGIEWTVAHSGGSVHETAEWRDMLARAGRDFDVLLVAYTSRLSRRAEEALRATRLIEEAGASVYFAEERVHSTDSQQWESFAREAVEAEAYRRRLSRTMKRTYASRARRRGLPAGMPPYGYRSDWTPEPDEAAIVASIFTTYATGDVSLTKLAKHHDLAEEQVKVIVRNPAYKGMAQHNGDLYPGSFPAIVDAATWDAVAEKRATRRWTAGGRTAKRPSAVSNILYCQCGTRLRLDGLDGSGQHRVRHVNPCDAWGKAERKRATYFSDVVKKALSGIEPTEAHIAEMIARSQDQQHPVARPDTRATREALARRFARGEIDLPTFTARIAALDAQDAAIPATTATEPPLTADEVRYYYSIFQHPTKPDRDGDDITASEAMWARLVKRVFRRIEYCGENHLRVELTDEATRLFVAARLPQVVLVGGEGSQPRVTTAWRITVTDPHAKAAARASA